MAVSEAETPVARPPGVVLSGPSTRAAARSTPSHDRLLAGVLAADGAVLALSLLVLGRGHGGPLVTALLMLPVWLACGVYDLGRGPEAQLHARTVSTSTVVVGACGAALIAVFGTDAEVAATVVWATAVAAGTLAVRATAAIAGATVRRAGRALSPTLVVGAGTVGRLAARRLEEHPVFGLQVIGFVDDQPLDGSGPPVLGGLDQLEWIVAEQAITTVVIGFSRATHVEQIEIVRRCWALGLTVLVVPRLFEVEGTRGRIHHVGALALVSLERASTEGPALHGKAIVERLVALVMILLLAPLLAVVAIAIRLIDRHPVLHRAERQGRDDQVFTMLKFRTMRGEAELAGQADAAWAAAVLGSAADAADPGPDRRTRLGILLRRYGIDELPQLFNVLRGDMALIGPRPERVSYARRFGLVVPRYNDRHRVLPGITGWAQIQGLRGETSLEDRVEWDNFYIDNWSPGLDLRVASRTLAAIARGATD